MSADTVDDLHAAEDTIAELGGRITQVLNGYPNLDGAARLLLQDAYRTAVDYCRPSCDDGACDDDCGCPYDHPTGPHTRRIVDNVPPAG
jgi:hypothetical protein